MTPTNSPVEDRRLVARVRVRAEMTGRTFAGQLLSDAIDSTEVLASMRRFRRRGMGYSQFGEDKVISALLPERFGRYWDLGAGHPVELSNTYLLYRRGFRGLGVEPIGSLTRKWRRSRTRDQIVQALVSTEGGSATAQFWEFERWALSTCEEARARALVDSGQRLHASYEVPSVPVMELLVGEVEPGEPTFLSIDLEGADTAVLRQVDFSRFRPRVIAVEDHQIDDDRSEISFLLSANGYRPVSRHWVTSIWLADDWRKSVGFPVPGAV